MTSNANAIRHFLGASLCVLSLHGAAVFAAQAFELTSPGLPDGGTLPLSHAGSQNNCGGGDVSPALQWSHAPAGTRSFAITIFDPDAAQGMGVVHWVMYGIPASTTSLAAGGEPPAGAHLGLNVSGKAAYRGPCPPAGEIAHHYFVQIYALDLPPAALPAGLTRDALHAAIKGHVLANTSTVMRFGR
ncbi:YbhB/YbcL family Raf kinase inhibitor-like protein [Trinickia dinghuensis]|uniref:YbhB/YbcL family Raf kinase inhibitor-like protein n=1 Tax=Trinickia dinghuensis TaxID=2291023 RepID=A0A3D8JUV9_9BURK|nr:YbhB/YbcL family Raf kinase inhibitor-like protein [Trinickia dinghuensis]RDU96515.1 YbhB/YbcL family Raf kinase inhibitor-like protein [Trinickia dinghuensis]